MSIVTKNIASYVSFYLSAHPAVPSLALVLQQNPSQTNRYRRPCLNPQIPTLLSTLLSRGPRRRVLPSGTKRRVVDELGETKTAQRFRGVGCER